MYKKPIRLPSSYMLILCSMHINCQLLDALLKNPVALKVLVWSRGRLVTHQILTSSSFSLVEGTHGSSGQCVSFSLIGVGSGFTAYVVFLFLFFFLFLAMLILCTMLISLFRPDALLSILPTFKPIRRGLLAFLPATLLILTDPPFSSGEGAFLPKWPLLLN